MVSEFILVALIGISIGFIGGYSGIGGAPFVVFFLIVMLGFSQHEAQGTVLAMMLGPMSLLAVKNSWDLVKPKLIPIIICIFTYATTSFVGSLVAYMFISTDLQRLFGFVLMVIGGAYATLFIEKYIARKKKFEINSFSVGIVGILVGFFGGMFGIGAGILLVPILTSFFGLEQNIARAMSLTILLPPVSLGAVIKYGLIEEDINWTVAVILLISYIILNGVGASYGNKENPIFLKRILGLLLFLSGILLVYTA